MNKESLPCITEDLLRKYADAQSFQRGKAYYSDEAIREPVRVGCLLQGLCEGSRREPYEVRVFLGEQGVQEAFCTCPRGGFCKHIVALLLTYIHEPDAFYEMDSLQDRLAGFSKEDLIKVICHLVQLDPSLVKQVERRISLPGTSRVDTEFLRRDVRRILRMSYLSEIEGSLGDLLQIARDSDDWLEAGMVYKEVLDGLTAVYQEEMVEMDDEGDISEIARECVDGLGECLARCDDEAVRQGWLNTLLEAELADIAMGGIEFSGDALDLLFNHCSEEDWILLEKRVLAEIPGKGGWVREKLVGILIEVMERTGRSADITKVIEEMGTNSQIMFLRARQGNPREAVRMAKEHFLAYPGIIIQLAGVLAESGAAHDGVVLLTQLAQSQHSSPGYLEWLAVHFGREGNLEEALKWRTELFLGRPGVESYKVLQEIGEKLNVWGKLRQEALKALEEQGRWPSLLEIALHEEEVDRALELLPRVQGGWRNYQAEVARAAEGKRPHDAIALYEKMAVRCIHERKRHTYQQAAMYLQRIKILYEGLQERAKWETTIAGLKKEFARLPALQDELKKAGL